MDTLERTGPVRRDANGVLHQVTVGRCSCGCPYLYAVDDLRLVWGRGDWETDDQGEDRCTDRTCACHRPATTQRGSVERRELGPGRTEDARNGSLRTVSGTRPEATLGTVKDATTTPVVTIRADDHLGAAARTLERARVDAGPVVRDGRVVGVVSMGELRSALPRSVEVVTTGPFHRWEQYLDEVPGLLVHEVITGRGVRTTPETALADAARLLVCNGMKVLPVVDAEGRPMGILSRQDVVEAVAAL